MSNQLQGLIDQIKNEGVLEAKKESTLIVEKANKSSGEIISKAHKDAEAIIAEAKQEAERFRVSSEKAVEQAARNIILGLNNEISSVFDGIVKEKVSDALSEEFLKEILVKIIESWLQNGKESTIEVMLNDKDKKNIEKSVLASLAAKMKQGVEFKPVKEVKKGFLVGMKGSNVFYDITETGITEMLMEYLNPKIKEILSKINKK